MKGFLRFVAHVIFVLICLLGFSATFVPNNWITFPMNGPTQVGRAIVGEEQVGALKGTDTWHGIATAVTFLALLLFRLATGARKPAPVWRPIITLVAGVVIVIILLAYDNIKYWEGPPTVAAGAAIGLLVLACIEIRGWLAGQPSQAT